MNSIVLTERDANQRFAIDPMTIIKVIEFEEGSRVVTYVADEVESTDVFEDMSEVLLAIRKNVFGE